MKIKNLLTIFAIILVVCGILTSTGTTSSENDGITGYFFDITKDDWFYEDVKYTKEKGLMQGTAEDAFSPSAETTRAMLVTILWRLEGSPEGYIAKFSDVGQDDYFCNSVAWAAANGIVSGYSTNLFAPNGNATREQLVAIIYRYASFKKYDMSKSVPLDAYADKDFVSEYAIEPFGWAVANNIISGTSDDILSPCDYVQRSQFAAVLHRFSTQFGGSETSEPKETGKLGGTTSTFTPTNKTETVKNSGSSDGLSGSSSKKNENTENAEKSTISVDTVTAKPGDTVQVIARVDNNPGILGMILSVYFDDANLTCLSVENGAAFESVLDFTPAKELGNGANVLWDSIDLKDDDVHNGEILVMNFKVSESAPAGNYPISLKYFDDDIVDKNLNSISPQITNGYIVVSDC